MNSITKGYLNSLAFTKEIVNLEDIKNLIKAHEKTFAFSSLKVLLKEDISLKVEDIFESIVIQKRGGYCFEHNKLFYEVLKDLGFEVEFFLARVVNNLDNEVAQTHRFTLLKYEEERYLIDVGVGFRSPNTLIKFDSISTYSHLGISFSIKEFDDKTYALQLLQKKNEAFTVTKFDLNRCFEADFEMGHFYSHKHPCAVFVNNLVISCIKENEIRSLRNSDYFKMYENKEEKIEIDNLKMFGQILKEDFNVNFNDKEVKFFYENYIRN